MTTPDPLEPTEKRLREHLQDCAFCQEPADGAAEPSGQSYERTPFLDEFTEAEGEALAAAGCSREQVEEYAREWEFSAYPILARELAAAERRGREAAIADLRDRERYLNWLRSSPADLYRREALPALDRFAEYLESQTKPVEVGGDE